MIIPRLSLVLLLIFSPIALAELEFHDPWIKNLPPSVPVRAGYMTIHNPQSETVSIVSLRSQAFASIEIHQTIEQDGMMRMEQVTGLKIEPDSSVQLAPGGLHLMMMNPSEPTQPGDLLEIVIVLDDGSEQSVEMQVKK
ncbi:MAG: copper chaperone PCu(A)C [Gammaproteobacteria bacterium]|nr:copper chaperone PCu(A)C [Gammaproteobacteria bacterium]